MTSWAPVPLREDLRESLPDKLIVYDGDCLICNAWVQAIMRRDKKSAFNFVSAHSELGQRLMRACRVDPINFETALYIEQNKAGIPIVYFKLDGISKILTQLGGIWRAAYMRWILPRFLANFIYDKIARRRYRF